MKITLIFTLYFKFKTSIPSYMIYINICSYCYGFFGYIIFSNDLICIEIQKSKHVPTERELSVFCFMIVNTFQL